jgi:hypothetical protein
MNRFQTFAFQMQRVPLRLVFALLRSPMLRASGVGADSRTHLRLLASRLDPPSLVGGCTT